MATLLYQRKARLSIRGKESSIQSVCRQQIASFLPLSATWKPQTPFWENVCSCLKQRKVVLTLSKFFAGLILWGLDRTAIVRLAHSSLSHHQNRDSAWQILIVIYCHVKVSFFWHISKLSYYKMIRVKKTVFVNIDLHEHRHIALSGISYINP